jgi:hypothetical protein
VGTKIHFYLGPVTVIESKTIKDGPQIILVSLTISFGGCCGNMACGSDEHSNIALSRKQALVINVPGADLSKIHSFSIIYIILCGFNSL